MNRVLKELVEAVFLAAIVFLLIQTSLRNFKVEGLSMDPTLEGGQYLMVNKLVYFQVDLDRLARTVPFWRVDEPAFKFAGHPPERGEIIVFHFPKDPTKDFVKRVIGLPGELVEIRDGKVYVNGDELPEPYIEGYPTQCQPPSTVNNCPLRLGEGEYYVLGDNRPYSNDSRRWGRSLNGRSWAKSGLSTGLFPACRRSTRPLGRRTMLRRRPTFDPDSSTCHMKRP